MNNIYSFLKIGVEEIVSDNDFIKLLKRKNKLVIKVGFDPTSNKLHLGHYILLKKLREFQAFGFFIYLIIGDFTAVIGDPSGKNSARTSLNVNNVQNNYKFYNEVIFRFLDKKLTYIYFNSVWFNFLFLCDFIQILSFCTVSKILDRNDFKNRYLLNKPIGLHEFIYPVLQSFDSVFLCSDIEFGGVDQRFNLLLAREFQKNYFQNSQVIIMMPILLGLDGVNKMSKSLNNCIYLNDDYYDIFCKIMSISDNMIAEYFFSLNILDKDKYNVFFLKFDNIMDVKFFLAYSVVSLLYNSDFADQAKFKFIEIFSKKNVSYDICADNIYIDFDFINIFDLFLKLKLKFSNSEIKRLLKYDSIKVNLFVINNKDFLFFNNNYYILQVGKKILRKIFIIKN